jgi:hypothetical protein
MEYSLMEEFPRYNKKLPCELKSKILSAGWIIYNEKTIMIELGIISPVCNDIIQGCIPVDKSNVIRAMCSETLVDESYHTLNSVYAVNFIKENRSLDLVKQDLFCLEKNMLIEMDKYHESWKKKLVRLACSIVSEMFISDYLLLLSDNKKIQPYNRMSVDAHRKDELAHHKLFNHLALVIYNELDLKQKDFFLDQLFKPVKWFSDKDLDIWSCYLCQLKVPNCDEIINDCRGVVYNEIDYSSIEQLCLELNQNYEIKEELLA